MCVTMRGWMRFLVTLGLLAAFRIVALLSLPGIDTTVPGLVTAMIMRFINSFFLRVLHCGSASSTLASSLNIL
jgi:hypothetical protein